MVRTTDKNLPTVDLLEVAFQAQVGVADRQHFGVHRAVRSMTNGAPLSGGLVLEHVWPALFGMTLDAAFVLRNQSGTPAAIRRALMRRMTVAAAHLAFRHRMVARQVELATHVR